MAKRSGIFMAFICVMTCFMVGILVVCFIGVFRVIQKSNNSHDNLAFVLLNKQHGGVDGVVLYPESDAPYDYGDSERKVVTLSSRFEERVSLCKDSADIKQYLNDLETIYQQIIHGDLPEEMIGLVSMLDIVVKNPEPRSGFEFDDRHILEVGEVIKKLNKVDGSAQLIGNGGLEVWQVVRPNSPSLGVIFFLSEENSRKLQKDYRHFKGLYRQSFDWWYGYTKESELSVAKQKAGVKMILEAEAKKAKNNK